MTKLQETVSRAHAELVLAEIFVLKYGDKLPDGLGGFWTGSFGTSFDIALRSRSDDDRQKALTLLGEVFGRAGWLATMNQSGYGFHGFDWSKTVDGVKVKIEGAQRFDQPESFPVDPRSFPLQLEDAQP